MKKRIFNLDLIRIIGLLLIVFNHALNTVWDATNYSYWLNSEIGEKIFIVIGYVICRLGVPLFLMLTGALILNKKFETKSDIIGFYKKNLFNLVLVVLIWNFIYYIFDVLYNNNIFNIKELIYILLFMKKSAMPHMWYMPMIIGMYLALPFLSAVVKKYDFESVIVPLLVSVIFFYLIPNFKTFLNFWGYKAYYINSILDLSFFGGVYGLYIVMGYYIYNKKIFEKISKKTLSFVVILGLIISCIFQIIGYLNESKYIIYYNFIGILVSSIFLFEILRRHEKCNNKIIKNKAMKISKFTLGIYFIHRPLLFIFKKYWVLKFNSCINIFIYYLCSLIVSYSLVLVFSKFGIFKKYLFLVKD